MMVEVDDGGGGAGGGGSSFYSIFFRELVSEQPTGPRPPEPWRGFIVAVRKEKMKENIRKWWQK